MKRRSKVATQRSATQGLCCSCPACPPTTALTLIEARREASGTTSIDVMRVASSGPSRDDTASTNAAMSSIALRPR